MYSASGYCWMLQLLLVSQPNEGHLCSHIFVPLCTCVWKIKFLEEKLLGEKHAYFKFGLLLPNFWAKVCQYIPTKCESFRFPASLAKLEMIGHFGLCHLIGNK